MTKSEIFDFMAGVVIKDMKSYKLDFYKYDLQALTSENAKFPYIWCVRPTGTDLLRVGEFAQLFNESENVRYDYVQSGNPFMGWLSASKDVKMYLVTDEWIDLIGINKAKEITDKACREAAEKWVAANGPLPVNPRIRVSIYGITLDKLLHLIRESENKTAPGKRTLLDILRGFRRRCCCHGHRVVLRYWEDEKNPNVRGFGWEEYWGDSNCARYWGAVKFHGWPETGYLTNNSVQLSPSYGWSFHS